MNRWEHAWSETRGVFRLAWRDDGKRRAAYVAWRRPFELVVSLVAYAVMCIVFGPLIFGFAR